MGLSQAQNELFCHFLEFRYLVFFEIAHDDSLRQCLTSSKEKNPRKKKKFGIQIWVKRAKIGPKISPPSPPFSQVWLISFPLNSIG